MRNQNVQWWRGEEQQNPGIWSKITPRTQVRDTPKTNYFTSLLRTDRQGLALRRRRFVTREQRQTSFGARNYAAGRIMMLCLNAYHDLFSREESTEPNMYYWYSYLHTTSEN